MVRLVSKSLQGIITTWNKSAERVFGYTADEAVRRAITMLIPEDRLDEEPAILARIRSGERVDHFETIRRRKDGTLINISLTISPIRAGNGKIIGASKIARDISDRKRAGQHQDLLREMHHRVKNLFAITGSIITLAARTAQSPAELATGMKDRLVALSQAHEMTPASFTGGETFAEQSMTLFTILTSLLSPFEGEEEGRWRLHGEDAQISASQSNPERTAWLSLVSESVRDVRIGPAFLFLLKQRLPFGMMRLGVLPWVSAMATNVAVILLAALLIWSVGIIPFLLIHLPIVLIAGSGASGCSTSSISSRIRTGRDRRTGLSLTLPCMEPHTMICRAPCGG